MDREAVQATAAGSNPAGARKGLRCEFSSIRSRRWIISARDHSQQKARELLARFAASLSDVAVIEREPTLDGRTMTMTLAPRRDSRRDGERRVS